MNFDSIFKFFVPKNKSFFPLFEQSARNLVEASVTLKALLVEKDPVQQEVIIKKIKDLELAGDEITHTIYDHLHQSFITPFDREDINALASSLDDIVDFINGASQKIGLYKPKGFLPEFNSIADILHEAAKEIEKIMYDLDNIQQYQDINKMCIRINTLENQADDIYHKAISDLFSNETNAVELIKQKDILLNLEKAVDKAEDASDVLKGIIIKNA
jgi:uncharacterized protein